MDIAPDLIVGRSDEAARLVTRGQEIHAWFTKRGAVDPCVPAETFAILDDRADQEPCLHRLVLTSIQCGLTAADADRAIALLLP
ncbi:MAG: hypothetical protein GXX91_17515 [Verrucomicrobiaceae bacterium]|nr:hypothetical protein [Verrucomicrobiaceae bacterium]